MARPRSRSYRANVRFRAFVIASAATLAVGPALTAPAASAANVSLASKTASVSPAPKADRSLPISVIRGSVGPGFTISVGRHHAQPGRYRLVVRDRGSIHNGHIRGPGVNRKTGVPFTGRRAFTVRLQRGTYRIVCDPHRTQMHTRLVVG